MSATGHDTLSPEFDELALVLENVWTLLCSFLLMILQLGFAIVETGCVQERNLVSTLMKHLMVLMVGALAWILFGSWIAFQKSHPEVDLDDDDQAGTLLGLLLCLTTVTIALRGVAERSKVGAHVAMALAVPIALYPIALRWTGPGGWLEELDPPFHSGASGGELHLVGGVAAAVGARLAGPRKETAQERSFLLEKKARKKLRSRAGGQEKLMYRAPSVVLGTLIMWVGWYGFGAVCTTGMRTKAQALIAARMAVNTTLGAASGGLMALLLRVASLKLLLRRKCRVVSSEEIHDMNAKSGPLGHASSVDFVVCCFGAISGLVAIASGSDCVENGAALVVGALGSLAGFLGARASKALKIDDPMEAGSVHGLAGAVGVLCVGLFHRREGLLVAGGWGLLRSQFIGLMVIGSFTGLASFVIFKALRCSGVLGSQRQRTKQELTLESMQELLAILDRADLSIMDTLEALAKLRGVIFRPFSPQAGNHKIQGEVLDVCNLLSYVVKPEDEYIAFISHYKAEGGDAARIIYDHITQAVLKRVGLPRADSGSCMSNHSRITRRESARGHAAAATLEEAIRKSSSKEKKRGSHDFFGVLPRMPMQLTLARRSGDATVKGARHSDSQYTYGLQTPPPPPPVVRGSSDGNLDPGRWSVTLERGPRGPHEVNVQQDSDHNRGPSPSPSSSSKASQNNNFPERGDDLMVHTQTHGTAAESENTCIVNLRNHLLTGSAGAKKFDSDRLLFLDSCELRDLGELLNAVRRSSNFLLLLTQGVLTRPWVLAELSVAVAEHKNIVAVRVEWPCQDDEKHFDFPDCIDGVVQQLECCAVQLGTKPLGGGTWMSENVNETVRNFSRRLSLRSSGVGSPSASGERLGSSSRGPGSPRTRWDRLGIQRLSRPRNNDVAITPGGRTTTPHDAQQSETAQGETADESQETQS